MCVCPMSMLGLDATVYINSDTLTTIGVNIAACRINADDAFSMQNAKIQVAVGEDLNLTVVNNDGLDHNIVIDGILEDNNLVPALGSETFTLNFTEAGAFRFYSDKPYGGLIGASGILLVGYTDDLCYYWNLFDTEHVMSHELHDQVIDDIPDDYRPEVFTINGKSFPGIADDPNTAITVGINEEVIIAVANPGNMDHMLHWHGFHIEILYSNLMPERVAWIKDTFPVKQGDCMILRMIPDKLGVYPVHNHNLVAVTNLGVYPGGMLTRITVTE
jgi:FtsP/CotA-like multicopper oxidase with cupredoxin domain